MGNDVGKGKAAETGEQQGEDIAHWAAHRYSHAIHRLLQSVVLAKTNLLNKGAINAYHFIKVGQRCVLLPCSTKDKEIMPTRAPTIKRV